MFFTIIGIVVVLIVCAYCILLGASMFFGNLVLSNKGGEMWFGLLLMVGSVFIAYETVHNAFNIEFKIQSTVAENNNTK